MPPTIHAIACGSPIVSNSIVFTKHFQSSQMYRVIACLINCIINHILSSLGMWPNSVCLSRRSVYELWVLHYQMRHRHSAIGFKCVKVRVSTTANQGCQLSTNVGSGGISTRIWTVMGIHVQRKPYCEGCGSDSAHVLPGLRRPTPVT